MLTIRNLYKSYHTKKVAIHALNNINLSIEAGMFGLLGPNGAGKSTLMRTIATLQRPDKGSITFNDRDVTTEPEYIRARLGYLPQDYGVYPGVTAYELMDYLAKLKGINDYQARHKQINQMLEQVNLGANKEQAVAQFSGGMRQRFGIAQALLGDPKIIIVDEPTAGLDPEERNRFHNLLVDVSTDKIVLLSTHIVEDVRQLCNQVAILSSGKITKQGPPESIISEINGKVWRIQIDSSAMHEYEQRYRVISQRLYAGKLTLHIYSHRNPGEGFQPVEPDLQDAYFVALKSYQTSGSEETAHASL